jgi:hypothetical protein
MAATVTLAAVEQLLGDVFTVRSVPSCFKQDEFRIREGILEEVQWRRVGGW